MYNQHLPSQLLILTYSLTGPFNTICCNMGPLGQAFGTPCTHQLTRDLQSLLPSCLDLEPRFGRRTPLYILTMAWIYFDVRLFLNCSTGFFPQKPKSLDAGEQNPFPFWHIFSQGGECQMSHDGDIGISALSLYRDFVLLLKTKKSVNKNLELKANPVLIFHYQSQRMVLLVFVSTGDYYEKHIFNHSCDQCEHKAWTDCKY